jgi:hypothetical protein
VKTLTLKILFFFSPIIFVSLIVFIVDPYNLFNVSKLFSDQAKIKCLNRSNSSAPRGNILWKTIEFRRNPTPNIILGDSRMVDVNPATLEKKLGSKVTNLAITAGNIQTIIDMFWMAAKSTELKNVFIQISFNRYNAIFNFDLFGPTKQLIDKPFYYFLEWNYIEDAFSVIYYTSTKDEEYVKQSYKFTIDGWYKTEKLLIKELSEFDYVYPKEYYLNLTKIANYCSRNHINLQFIIAPDFYETSCYIKAFHLGKEYLQFKQDIAGLANTIDLDNGMPFSFNKNNYKDYYHINPLIADTIISMIYQKISPINTK